jgi:hypothetical protein
VQFLSVFAQLPASQEGGKEQEPQSLIVRCVSGTGAKEDFVGCEQPDADAVGAKFRLRHFYDTVHDRIQVRSSALYFFLDFNQIRQGVGVVPITRVGPQPAPFDSLKQSR